MKDTYKNVHSHIFTMKNAPEYFLSLYMPKQIAKLFDSATNTKAGVLLFKNIIKIFGEQGKRYVSFLELGKSKDQFQVFNELMAQYPEKAMEIVALTMNMEYIGAGKSESGFDGQLQEVIDIKRKFPDNLNVFMGIDPRWKSSGTELRKTVERYFETKVMSGDKSIYPLCGLKIYPSTGFYAFDEKLKETFEWAADNGVPVMTHCYYLGGIFNYNKATIMESLNPFDPYSGTIYDKPTYIDEWKFGKWIKGSNEIANNRKNCSYFLEPASYESMMRFFDTKNHKLKMCMAHFGGIKQIEASLIGTKETEQKTPYGVKKVNWFTQIQQLLSDYEGVYTDISYGVAEAAIRKNDKLFETFFQEANKPYGKKILFGTDFFMTEMQNSENTTYARFKKFASAKTLSDGENYWDSIAKNNTNKFLDSKYY